jgi:hypothetical protein
VIRWLLFGLLIVDSILLALTGLAMSLRERRTSSSTPTRAKTMPDNTARPPQTTGSLPHRIRVRLVSLALAIWRRAIRITDVSPPNF